MTTRISAELASVPAVEVVGLRKDFRRGRGAGRPPAPAGAAVDGITSSTARG